jgi:predicted nucleic acid-binding protein
VDRFVVDASVIVASLLPDEPYRDAALHVLTQFLFDSVELVTLPLMKYEVANALWKALKAGRVKREDALAALKEFEAFNIPESEVSGVEALKLAQAYDRSAYDAAYLALAKAEKAPLITADKRLYNALKGKFSLLLTVKRNPSRETLGRGLRPLTG